MQCSKELRSSSSSSSFDGHKSLEEGSLFTATNTRTAKEKLLQLFKNAHLDGHIICVNSRHDYVYCKCKKCNCTAAAKLSNPPSTTHWIVSKVHHAVNAPCLAQCTLSHSVSVRLLHADQESCVPAPVQASAISTTPDAPVYASAPVPTQCCLCQEECGGDMFVCPNPAAHSMCQDCFERSMTSQFGEDLQMFINRNCTIVCCLCAPEAIRSGQGETIPFNPSVIGRISPVTYDLYLKACAEKHVLEALAIQERTRINPPSDVVASALATLADLERCPGPACSVPFEHTGECCSFGKCTLSDQMQVDVRPCTAPVAKSIFVFGAGASSSKLPAAVTRMMAWHATTTFLIAQKLQTKPKY
jgi:hypothetical protein